MQKMYQIKTRKNFLLQAFASFSSTCHIALLALVCAMFAASVVQAQKLLQGRAVRVLEPHPPDRPEARPGLTQGPA